MFCSWLSLDMTWKPYKCLRYTVYEFKDLEHPLPCTVCKTNGHTGAQIALQSSIMCYMGVLVAHKNLTFWSEFSFKPVHGWMYGIVWFIIVKDWLWVYSRSPRLFVKSVLKCGSRVHKFLKLPLSVVHTLSKWRSRNEQKAWKKKL